MSLLQQHAAAMAAMAASSTSTSTATSTPSPARAPADGVAALSPFLGGLLFVHQRPDDLPPRLPLSVDQDLVSMLGLRHLYDSLVRPHLPLQPSPQASSQSLSLSQSRPQQPIEPSYMPYIRDLPGKPDLIPDAGLRDLLFRPRLGDSVKPLPFDQQTLDMAFTLVPGVISGFDGTRYGLDEISLHDLDAKPESPAAIVTQEPAPEASLSLANGSATAGQEAPAPATAPALASASPPLPSSSSSSQPAPQAPQQAPQTQQAAQNRPAVPSSIPVAAAMHVPPGSVLKTNVSAATVVSSKAHAPAPAASAAATTTTTTAAAAAGSTAAPMTIKFAPPAAPPSGSATASATTTPAPAPPGAKLILRLGLRPDSMVSAEMKKKASQTKKRRPEEEESERKKRRKSRAPEDEIVDIDGI